MPTRTLSPIARTAMALAFLKPSRIRWSMRLIPSVTICIADRNDRLSYNDHLLREQVDCVRPGNDLLGCGDNHVRCEEDHLRHGKDRYGGNKDRYDREKDRYDRLGL